MLEQESGTLPQPYLTREIVRLEMSLGLCFSPSGNPSMSFIYSTLFNKYSNTSNMPDSGLSNIRVSKADVALPSQSFCLEGRRALCVEM